MTPLEVIDKIARGDVFVVTLTFPEGLTIAEMAKISSRTAWVSRGIRRSRAGRLPHSRPPIRRQKPGDISSRKPTVPRKTDAQKLVRLMVGRRARVHARVQDAAAARPNLGAPAVALASIVEKETAKADERPLSRPCTRTGFVRMPLQADPTVIFAIQQTGTYPAICGTTI